MSDWVSPRQFGADRCATCKRADVLEVNAALASGRTIGSVAVEYGIPRHALNTHWLRHVLTDEYEQGAIAIGWHDVVAIPLAMRERRQMQDAIVARIMKVLEVNPNTSALNKLKSNLLVAIWKLQMADEQTILRVAGVLKEPTGDVQMPAHEQFRLLQERMEATIAQYSNGDWAKQADLRLAIAQGLDPRNDIPEGLDTLEITDLYEDEYEELS